MTEFADFFYHKFGMKFVYIPPGEFMMGSPSDEKDRQDNETLHKVTLDKGFYIQTTPLTHKQWRASGFSLKGHNEGYSGDHPKKNVSWNDIQEFIKKMNLQLVNVEGSFRLPTEAEWEYACRAGTASALYTGSELDAAAWHGGDSGYPHEIEAGFTDYDTVKIKGSTHTVGCKQPNAWGLYDMIGNVWEWCQDCCSYESSKNTVLTDTYTDGVTDPVCRAGSFRIIRGGSWNTRASVCMAAYRGGVSPDHRSMSVGFRLIYLPSEKIDIENIPNEMKYKGYLFNLNFNGSRRMFCGNIIGISDDIILFEGASRSELKMYFHSAVKCYLKISEELNSKQRKSHFSMVSDFLWFLHPIIGQFVHIKELNFSYNHLSRLPPEIGNLFNLKTLSLNNNRINLLPPEIGQVTSLENLDLNNNLLSDLPPEIGHLKNLKKLILYMNPLSSLPPEFGQLHRLEDFSLSDNNLSSLPPEFGKLTNLKRLIIEKGQLSSLPSKFGQLINLEKLNLRKNCLTSLPPEFGQLSNLRELDLRGNCLASLPPEIGNLAKLEKLDLRSNHLTSLPPEIGNLKNLTFLNLERNLIVSLPREIGQLANLSYLSIAENILFKLPPEIAQLDNLNGLGQMGSNGVGPNKTF